MSERYFLEQIVKNNTATKEENDPHISPYDSVDDAERAFHKVFYDNIGKEGVTFIRCKVINSQGGKANDDLLDVWKAKISEPESNEGEEPEPTPVESEKYYFTQIRYFVNPETPINRSMQEFDTEDEALIQYHKLLYNLPAESTIAAVTVLIEGKEGNELHRRYWERKY